MPTTVTSGEKNYSGRGKEGIRWGGWMRYVTTIYITFSHKRNWHIHTWIPIISECYGSLSYQCQKGSPHTLKGPTSYAAIHFYIICHLSRLVTRQEVKLFKLMLTLEINIGHAFLATTKVIKSSEASPDHLQCEVKREEGWSFLDLLIICIKLGRQ